MSPPKSTSYQIESADKVRTEKDVTLDESDSLVLIIRRKDGEVIKYPRHSVVRYWEFKEKPTTPGENPWAGTSG